MGAHNGDYTSDYHKLGTTWRAEVWNFEIKSSDPDSVVTLSWEGSEGKDRFSNSTLIDLETGNNVPVSLSGNYTVRRFQRITDVALTG